MNSDGERVLEATWARTPDMQFLAAIKLVGEDRVGLINDLTDVLSKSLKTNMKSINVSSDSGMFEGIVTLYVSDLSHLDQIMEKLKRVEGIRTAHRFE